MAERVGLALSGGGFRAAFFHVGVLARLAEAGLLAKVEVISTVSGGSIVGALYYLLLKRELEAKGDGEITAAGYVALVQEVERQLLEGVQQNIRARIFANLFKNLRMGMPDYSRSDRIGDLYDRYLYKAAWGERETRPGALDQREKQIEMPELTIHPGGDEGFVPSKANEKRSEKVPILLLNATSLNSGHNWRFEAVRMGEPLPDDEAQAATVQSIDKNIWLTQGYFEAKEDQPQLRGDQAHFPLGLAVAASAAVPGIFKPLAITGMYEGVRVQLVDGGVQDNQGIQGLLDRGCTRMIVSDASGQMEDKEKPRPWLISVLGRSSSVAQDRIRDAQLIGRSGSQNVALMHLRRGLAVRSATPGTAPVETPPPEGEAAEFGVDPEVQRALSEIRTDLDFFSRAEARSLALDGYRMSGPELAKPAFAALADPGAPPSPSAWDFNAVADKIDSNDAEYLKRLRAGKHRFFRPSRLHPLRALAGLLLLVVLAYCFRGRLGDAGDGIGDLAGDVAGLSVWALVPLLIALVPLLLATALFAWSQLSLLAMRLYER
jgi:NTE family protein